MKNTTKINKLNHYRKVVICKVQKTTIVLLLLFSQITYAQNTATAEKKDGRFITTINVDAGVARDMFKSATLGIQWWSLLDQPVYHYKFKWYIKDEISFWHEKEGNVTLRLDELQDYPKLQNRYKQLKPSDIEIELFATLKHYHSQGFNSGDSFKRFGDITFYKIDGSSGENWFEFASKITIKQTPELTITTSGKLGDNMTPASPRDFVEFFDGSTVELLLFSDSKSSINEKLALTYKLADKIEYSVAEISNITLPNRELTAIYDALKKGEDESKNLFQDELNKAQGFIETKQYDKALQQVEEIEALNDGKKLASAQNIRVKALVGKKEFVQAKKELDILYDLNLTPEILRDIAIYKEIIEAGLEDGKQTNDGGIITDKSQNLMWMRCSLGQTWNKNTLHCDGETENFSLYEAKLKAKNYSYAGYSDWRVPTIEELETLVYCTTSRKSRNSYGRLDGCTGNYERPTINQEKFPDIPSSIFYSASPFAISKYYVWCVDFNLGYSYKDSHVSYRDVRLVRSGQ